MPDPVFEQPSHGYLFSILIVLRHGLSLAVIGLAVGLVLTFGADRAMAGGVVPRRRRQRTTARRVRALGKPGGLIRNGLEVRRDRLHSGEVSPTERLPEDIEEYRDTHWLRSETSRVETPEQAERFIGRVGFAACMTDSRRPGPSLYVAVCGRRDAVTPRNVQTDPETSRAWQLKDELLRRGHVYYGKLARGQAMFLAPRLISCFKAIRGVPRRWEPERLGREARAILAVLRKEGEMGTADLRTESRVTDRKAFTRAMDELQAAMIVVPGDVIYRPKFSYIWELAAERFPEELAARTDAETAVREIARCFLDGAGMTFRGELARVTGLSRVEAGAGNQALVRECYATAIAPGTYRLARLSASSSR